MEDIYENNGLSISVVDLDGFRNSLRTLGNRTTLERVIIESFLIYGYQPQIEITGIRVGDRYFWGEETPKAEPIYHGVVQGCSLYGQEIVVEGGLV